MKRIFVIALVMTFAASLSMAQHWDQVYQSGNSNNSSVVQGFMDVGTAKPGNGARVWQIGNQNLSDLKQFNGGYAGDQHYAEVYSYGNNNTAYTFQSRATGTSYITQIGDWNYGNVYQNGNVMNSEIYSQGNANWAQSILWATNSYSKITQLGNNNVANQLMGQGMGEKVQGSYFESYQQGNQNFSHQHMAGDGYAGGITALNNTGIINTFGNNNSAVQYMYEGSTSAANNWANAYQNGNWNNSQQYQTNAGNSSVHWQIGDGNVSVTVQN